MGVRADEDEEVGSAVPKPTILDEARAAVHGERQRAYGHPLVNHGTTAEMWSAYLSRRAGVRVTLAPEDVCWLNILQKVSRSLCAPTRDNMVDAAGYAANVEMIEDERARRAGEP